MKDKKVLRKMVMDYIDEYKQDPLHFDKRDEADYYYLDNCECPVCVARRKARRKEIDFLLNSKFIESLTSETSLKDLVIGILRLSLVFASYNSENLYETDCGRFRSSLDIWRHAKYYKPDITIFDVMAELYNIREQLFGQFCDVVERRVFKISFSEETHGFELLSTDENDEYDLKFYEWEKINE